MKPLKPVVVKSADRVLDLLELLARKPHGLTHTELADTLDIPKSSLTQLVGNLQARDYLTFTPGPNVYMLGPALMRLVRRGQIATDLPALAQPITDRITKLTGESSSLNLLRDDQVQRVCGVNASHPLQFSMTIGELAPLYAVSSGKILLALMPEAEREAYLARMKPRRITPHTITSLTTLRRELRAAARNGVAYSFEESAPGIVGSAVAVLDEERRPGGALTVAMPSVRDSARHRRTMLAALRDGARRLEQELRDAGLT